MSEFSYQINFLFRSSIITNIFSISAPPLKQLIFDLNFTESSRRPYEAKIMFKCKCMTKIIILLNLI